MQEQEKSKNGEEEVRKPRKRKGEKEMRKTKSVEYKKKGWTSKEGI